MVPLALDKEQFLLQCGRLEEHLQQLSAYRKKKRDAVTSAALERMLQLAIEDILNIGNHLISGLGLPHADTYREIFQVLERAKLISPKLSKELQTFAVFRNRLVHLYWKINPEEFAQQLRKTPFLVAFVRVIAHALKKRRLL